MKYFGNVFITGILVLFLVPISCKKSAPEVGKAPEIEWMKVFGGTQSYTKGNSVIQDFDGNLVIAGSSCSNSKGTRTAYMLKTDKNGNDIWAKTFDSKVSAELEELLQISDSAYISVGNISTVRDLGNKDVYTIQTNKNGKLIWSKIYESKDNESGNCVVENSKGELVIGGLAYPCDLSSGSQRDIYAIKINHEGDLVWTNIYLGSGLGAVCSSIQRSDGAGYFLVGFYNTQLILLKIDKNGDMLWKRTYGDEFMHSSGKSIRRTSNGDYIIVGYANVLRPFCLRWKILQSIISLLGLLPSSFEQQISMYLSRKLSEDFYLLKVDNEGNRLWSKTYGGKLHECAYSVRETKDGGFIVAGGKYTSFGPNGVRKGLIIKIDKEGNLLWKKQIDVETGTTLYSIIQVSDGGYVATGMSDCEVCLIKLKPEE